MALFKRGRFLVLLFQELTKKYSKSLAVGLIIGILGSFPLWVITPIVLRSWMTPVERIGMVGEFTPTTLPLSIQNELSTGLTTIAPDGQITPALADRWESTDSGKLYTFYLKKNIRWHNNRAVEAKDINYNIRDVTFTAIGTNIVQARLSVSYGPFPSLVARPLLTSGLIGFGPYKVDSIRLKGNAVQYLRLVPVSGKGKAREYRFYRTEATAISAFKLGDVDTLVDIRSPEPVKSWGKVKIKERIFPQRIMTIFFNVKNTSLSARAFRQALGYGLPKFDQLAAGSPIGKTSWAYTDKIKNYESNSIQAKKLLETIDAATSSATLTLTTFSQYVEEAERIAASWTVLGVPTKVKIENEVPSDFQILLALQNIPPDPDQYPFWHSTQERTNITGYENKKVDKLLEDGRQEGDMTKRKKIYADFQRFLVEDAPALFLYYPKTYDIVRIR